MQVFRHFLLSWESRFASVLRLPNPLDRSTLTLQQHSQPQRLLDDDVQILALRPMIVDRHPKTVLSVDRRVGKSSDPLLAHPIGNGTTS